jgi:hypothetical protein
LPEAWDNAWSCLGRAVVDRKHAFRTPVIATVGPDGAPRARVVVLRGADPVRGELVLHTDARSPKVEHLTRDGRLAWCFYDPRSQVQILASGPAVVEDPASGVDAAFDRLSPLGRRTYLVSPGPGTPLAEPGDGLEHLAGKTLDLENTEAGRAVFRRVVCTVEHFERLDLAVTGHRRAVWTRAGDGWHGGWVVP